MNRPSIYLVERATSMIQTIKFFNGSSYGVTQNDKHLMFITQLHFWDFEIESLIYVFQTFAERQKDWDNSGTTTIHQKILKQNIIVKSKYLSEFNTNLQNNSHHWNPYRSKYIKKPSVVEPFDLLVEAITTWNNLLDKCEYLLIDEKEAKSAAFAGCAVLENLSKFKKIVPEIEIDDTSENNI